MRHFLMVTSRLLQSISLRTALRLGAVVGVAASVMCTVGATPGSPASPSSGPLIEYWDGASWTQQVSPNPNGTGWFGAVTATSAHDAWAFGKYFGTIRDRALAAHWDGSTWRQVAMPTGNAEGLDFSGAAAISGNDVWAVGWKDGHTLTEHWNGSAWRIVPSPSPGGSAALAGVAAVSPRNVWAVGDYAAPHRSSRTLVLHWNGTNWKRIPSPHPGFQGYLGSRLSGVAVISARNIWAVGSYSHRVTSNNRTFQTLTLHWDGKRWRQVSSANPGGKRRFNALYDVAALGRNNVWAVGNYSTGHDPRPPLVEHWNGHSWQTFRAPLACPNSSTQPLTDLAPLAPNDIWAAGAGIVGSYPCGADSGPTSQALAEHWDGHAWTVSPIVNPPEANGDDFRGIAAATPHAVWAVGRTTR